MMSKAMANGKIGTAMSWVMYSKVWERIYHTLLVNIFLLFFSKCFNLLNYLQDVKFADELADR